MEWYQRKYREDAALDAAMRKVVEYDKLRTMKPPPKVEPDTPAPAGVTQQQHEQAINQYKEWKSDRAELMRLEECASSSAVKVIGVSGISSGVAFAVSQKLNRSKGRTAFNVVLAGLVGASLAYRQWGMRCGVDFIQSEGRVSAKARQWLRDEYPEHPILKEYDATHSTAGAVADTTTVTTTS